MENMLRTRKLPDHTLDVDLKTYAHIVCNLLDIPVHNNNIIESLHVLYTLYSEFKVRYST